MSKPNEPKIAYILEDGKNRISVDMPQHPPRLLRALLWAKPGRYEGHRTDLEKAIDAKERGPVSLDAADTFEAELGWLLKHVYQRLMRGLAEVWSSKYGYDPPDIPKEDGKTPEEYAAARKQALERSWALTDLYREPEEQWARAFAEMFVFMPYGGPAGMTFGQSTSLKDHDIYGKWPKVYPMVAACQHLSTYAVLTRGFAPSTVGTGLEAGPNAGVPILGKNPVTPPTRPGWTNAPVSSFAANDLHPGDVLSGDDGANKGLKGKQRLFGHSATTLRRWPLGAKATEETEKAGSGYKLQMIDTGVLAGAGDSSTQDYDWLAAVRGLEKAERTGFGRLPPPSDLAAAVEVMKKALPLGFARLVIVSNGSSALRYVSAMLPMWYGEERFAFTRYIWSLRNLPATGVDAYWIIYVPKSSEELFNQMVVEADGPKRSCQEMVAAANVTANALLAVASCASIHGKPKIVRSVTKGSTEWRNVEPNPKDKKDPAEPDPKSPTKLETGTVVAPTLDMKKLDASSGGRPGGWKFLASEKHLAIELLIPPGTNGSDVEGRSMTGNKVDYFKG